MVEARLVGYFHWRLSCPGSCQNGVKVKLSKDPQLQVFCFGKAICQLNVYRGNPRDGCNFHQESNDKRMKAKDGQKWASAKTFGFVAVLKKAVLNGSAKCRFKMFLNFSYKEQLTVCIILSF